VIGSQFYGNSQHYGKSEITITMKPLFALALVAAALTAGCHSSAQVPPSPAPSVALSWTAPAACTASAPCVFAISRAAASGSTCPATTGTTYALVGTSASQATTFTDSAPTQGTTVCYIAQTQQGIPVLTSQPSSTFLIAVPSLPASPSVLGGTSTASLAPETLQPMPEPTVAQNEPLKLRGRYVH
jgi:hypothetical protein